jgi:putative OPT family oligopeptide transporter
LGVAAVVCVSSSVAGELLQDFKVGYILGGTPRKIQMAELIAVVVASLAMYWPLYLLDTAFGFGSRQLSAPQAGLMATLAIGIVGGDMPWPLVVVGIFFGIAMIMMQVRSPMLVAVGMYLPFETTFAIFLGGVFRALGDWLAKRRGFNEAQRARVENAGVLTASGLIAGESVFGLLWAALIALGFAHQSWLKAASGWATRVTAAQIFDHPLYLAGLGVMALLAGLMIWLPLSSAGDPNEPAPPTAIM